MINKVVMSRAGKAVRRVQAYRCQKGHYFKQGLDSPWTDSFVEYVVFVYLRCLSLNTTVDIIRATYDDDVLNKAHVLEFVELVGGALPALDDIDRLFSPLRSGFLSFDGVWFKFAGKDIVLLVCFDPVSFDVISAIWADEETRLGYDRLMGKVIEKVSKEKVKGIYGDGDNGLILSLKSHFPRVPFQLCVVHKNFRMSQTVPVHLAKRSRKMSDAVKTDITEFARLFHNTLYASSKEKSVDALGDLLLWTHNHPNERFLKAVRQLKHNFEYTLTHFDYPGMQRDNNLIECFNGCIKPRLKLMRGFKKEDNLERYLKLFLLEFRFHRLKESRLNWRRGSSPLQLGGINFPKYHNFLTLLRKELHLIYLPKKS